MKEKLNIFKELWLYLLVRRRPFLFFLMILLSAFGILVAMSGSLYLAPFVYPLF